MMTFSEKLLCYDRRMGAYFSCPSLTQRLNNGRQKKPAHPTGMDRKQELTYIGTPRMSAHCLVQEYLNLHET